MRIRPIHVVFIIIICILLLFFATRHSTPPDVRPAMYAGSWYPGNADQLSSLLDSYFENAVQRSYTPKALIVPHAGYAYSGQVAAHAYNQLRDEYSKVIIIANNHNGDAPYFRFSTTNATHYETPLGLVPISNDASALLSDPLFDYVPEAHSTHVVELQLPFLQKKISNFEIIPVIIGSASYTDLIHAAGLISGIADDKTLIIVSSDFSHYHQYDEAVMLDSACIKSIEEQDIQDTCEACGLQAILILLEISRQRAWQVKVLEQKNSGDISGDKSRVVGYGSVVFYDDFTDEEKEMLLELARQTIADYLDGKENPVSEDRIPERLMRKQGCFVTLNKQGSLRGCIGNILPQEPLYECVRQNAINAAVNDNRFSAVERGELDDLEIEISVLSVPEKLEYDSPDQLLDSLVPGADGVVLRSGLRQSTFLPQVWNQLLDKRIFLEQLCLKQGSEKECWKTAQVFTYSATVWQEI